MSGVSFSMASEYLAMMPANVLRDVRGRFERFLDRQAREGDGESVWLRESLAWVNAEIARRIPLQ